MSETSIEWTATRRANDGKLFPGFTFNPWQGCVKVSPACKNCYAATFAARFGVEWGPKARRKFQSDTYWSEPLKWDRKAQREGVRLKVFCASMADVFELLPDGHPDEDRMGEERYRLYRLIEATPHLDWLLLTKRPENVFGLVAGSWLTKGFPPNVWLGATVEDRKHVSRVYDLTQIGAQVRFLSCEPLLEDIAADLVPWLGKLDWVITGGESGPGARPAHPAWFRSLRDACRAAHVAFHFKQFGNWREPLAGEEYNTAFGQTGKPPAFLVDHAGHVHCFRESAGTGAVPVINVGKKAAGRLLDGREWSEFPEAATP